MKKWNLWSLQKWILVAAIFWCLPSQALAGYWEFSLGFSYNRSEYGSESYSWSRRYGLSAGYHFTDSSEVELSFADDFTRNHYANYEDSFYRDRVYSANWVQMFLDKQSRFQPYVKAGVGLLNRDATVYDTLGRIQISRTDRITTVVGAGVKYYFSEGIGLKLEGTSYLTQNRLASWKNNFATTVGLSFLF